MMLHEVTAALPPLDPLARLGPLMSECSKPLISDEIMDRLFPRPSPALLKHCLAAFEPLTPEQARRLGLILPFAKKGWKP